MLACVSRLLLVEAKEDLPELQNTSRQRQGTHTGGHAQTRHTKLCHIGLLETMHGSQTESVEEDHLDLTL